jgi:predicted nucleic acid-binding protein
MSNGIFLDTNILVYLYDGADPLKQQRALAAVDQVISSGQAVISPQVMAEFYVATTRVKRPLLTPADAVERVHHFWVVCKVVEVTGLITLEALRGTQDYQMSFWDAQIWATAKLNQVQFIYSEDFATNSTIEGVKFINPLAQEVT